MLRAPGDFQSSSPAPLLQAWAPSGSPVPHVVWQPSRRPTSRARLGQIGRDVFYSSRAPLCFRAFSSPAAVDHVGSSGGSGGLGGVRVGLARPGKAGDAAPQPGRNGASSSTSLVPRWVSGSGLLRVRCRGNKDLSREGSGRAPNVTRRHPPTSQAHPGRPIGLSWDVGPRQVEGRHPRRSLRIRSRSASGGPAGPGAHPFLPQFNVQHGQAEAAAPGNGSGSFSSFSISSCVPHPPGRSSPEVSADVRECFCCKPAHVRAQQGTGL
ncbi:hypothetical protein NDU88_004684 [Pleurodeles waltl]|uniref:Uncharacterized protein n=1 Tax=Pleurodeles waltl TaxID=8319 RepID=A0AAV7QF95_PLEWA|nr:hypothetical protein NDU88_004684 [Pleurodeles waltl]